MISQVLPQSLEPRTCGILHTGRCCKAPSSATKSRGSLFFGDQLPSMWLRWIGFTLTPRQLSLGPGLYLLHGKQWLLRSDELQIPHGPPTWEPATLYIFQEWTGPQFTVSPQMQRMPVKPSKRSRASFSFCTGENGPAHLIPFLERVGSGAQHTVRSKILTLRLVTPSVWMRGQSPQTSLCA